MHIQYSAKLNYKSVFNRVLIESDLFLTRTITPFTEANSFTHIRETTHYSSTTNKDDHNKMMPDNSFIYLKEHFPPISSNSHFENGKHAFQL